MRIASVFVVSLALNGCASETSTKNVVQPLRPQPGKEVAVPSELRQLVKLADEIPAAGDDATHGKVVASLSLIAELLRADAPKTARTVDRLATELMRSPPFERGHADIAREALAVALESHALLLPREPAPAQRDAYVAARRALAQISDDEPLRFQLHEVAATVREVANLAALRRGMSPPFASSGSDVEVGYQAGAFHERVRLASKRVAALAAERKWAAAGKKAALALDALADAFAVGPLENEVAAWRTLVSAIRYEALRLERESTLSLDRSDHVKAGLAACVRALERLQPSSATSATDALVASARFAVEAIDEHTTFVFQRAIIQEAFRSIADALLVAGELRDQSGSSQGPS